MRAGLTRSKLIDTSASPGMYWLHVRLGHVPELLQVGGVCLCVFMWGCDRHRESSGVLRSAVRVLDSTDGESAPFS